MKTRIAVAAALGLAACVPVAEEVPMPTTPVEDACGASGLQGLVGQPRSVLATMKFAGPVRIIEPGMAVTMDYSAERLNIVIGETGWIESVSCG
jgi:hypothetical protein